MILNSRVNTCRRNTELLCGTQNLQSAQNSKTNKKLKEKVRPALYKCIYKNFMVGLANI